MVLLLYCPYGSSHLSSLRRWGTDTFAISPLISFYHRWIRQGLMKRIISTTRTARSRTGLLLVLVKWEMITSIGEPSQVNQRIRVVVRGTGGGPNVIRLGLCEQPVRSSQSSSTTPSALEDVHVVVCSLDPRI